MYTKRMKWLALLCAMALFLSSCGSAGAPPGETSSAAGAAIAASYRYVKTAIALPKENFIISNAEAAKSNIYLFGTEVTDAPNNYYIYVLDYDGNMIDQNAAPGMTAITTASWIRRWTTAAPYGCSNTCMSVHMMKTGIKHRNALLVGASREWTRTAFPGPFSARASSMSRGK